MITIANVSKPEEAHLLRLRLEAGGVMAYIQDESTIQIDWLFSNAMGGIRVQIAEEDLVSAREILQEPPKDEAVEGMPCPKCSSHQTAPSELPRRLSFLSLLLLGFPFMISKTAWKCRDCGNTWKAQNKSQA